MEMAIDYLESNEEILTKFFVHACKCLLHVAYGKQRKNFGSNCKIETVVLLDRRHSNQRIELLNDHVFPKKKKIKCYIVSLVSSLTTTAGTNIRNTALRIVHRDLLYIFTKVHQQIKQCQ